MNKFYGKSLNEMTFGELTLLSVDIQLTSFEKSNITNENLLRQSFVIREGLVSKCINDGGDYSRGRFVSEFNGDNLMEIEGGFDEYVEVSNINYISLN
jgi:hypothetical protein